MDDSQITHMIKSLEGEFADCERKTHIKVGKPDFYLFVTANRAGCLEIARTFLKAAIEPIDAEVCHSKPVPVEDSDMQVLDELKRTDFFLGGVMRRESWPEPNGIIQQIAFESRTRDKIALLGCAIASLLMLCLIGGGVAFWLMLFTGQIR